MQLVALGSLFYVDRLSILMISLVTFIGIVLLKFSKNYMQGDKNYAKYITRIILICGCVITMALANHLVLFAGTLTLSNILLIKLMIHNPEWKMAKASGSLATKVLALSSICLIASFFVLYTTSNHTSIQAIINMPNSGDNGFKIAMYIMLICALCQSAIWPFHRWLLSSLTSPTPVSALMHAGLINGGGFILIRFSALFINNIGLLKVIFMLGIITSVLGTFWKLIQNDYKRMLACSTMAQMGFMFMQCGLGLFSAAAAHLCWHGLFKAYLFLNSGSAAQENRLLISLPAKKLEYLYALICGLLGAYIFVTISGKTWHVLDANYFLIGVAFISSVQVAITVLANSLDFKILKAIVLTASCACFYGMSIGIISYLLKPLNLDVPQFLDVMHVIGFSILAISWLAFIFNRYWYNIKTINKFMKYMYVKALNASQPHPATVTTLHNSYA